MWDSQKINGLHKGGLTGLVLLSLLNCGLTEEDEAVAKGLKYLRENIDASSSTYVLALQIMVYAEVGDKNDLGRIKSCADMLLKSRRYDANGKLLGWSYAGYFTQAPDNSNTQYAILGLYSAMQAGVPMEEGSLAQSLARNT